MDTVGRKKPVAIRSTGASHRRFRRRRPATDGMGSRGDAEATRAPHHAREERVGNRISESTTERRTARGNNGFMRFGARTQIWEWRNQNPNGSRYLSTHSEKNAEIRPQSDQEVSGNFGMQGRVAPCCDAPRAPKAEVTRSKSCRARQRINGLAGPAAKSEKKASSDRFMTSPQVGGATAF
jgi:hypothetical protein